MSEPLLAGTHELIEALIEKLAAGDSLNNPTLTQLAEEAFGGTRAAGAYTSRDAYDALEAAANKHLATTAMELVKREAECFATLAAFTKRLPTQTDRVVEQTELQQFSTPPALALLAAKLLDTQPEEIVLEPSAGTESLAIWPQALGVKVVCNEIHPRRNALLKSELGFETFEVDAEIIDDVLPADIRPTAVLMNPPFTATGGRVKQHHARYGLNHIESALRRLEEGGRLVAIAGENLSFERTAVTGWWQKISGIYNVRANFGLSGKTYRKYGTNWGIQILVIDKTGPTPGGNWRTQLSHIVWGKAQSLAEAWSSLKHLRDRTALRKAELQQRSSQSSTLFVPYVPAKVHGGVPHPAVIVESASMASVKPPNITYRPRLPIQIITEGRLSDIQLERVIYAGQRHEQRLPDGARGGFFVGDGTGVGKGRVLAAIIADNWFQNRRRALWLSVNNDLLESARRDLNDLGVRIPLARINEYHPDGAITLACGVLFSSYSSLISESKQGTKRLDQIQRWLGTEPCVVFDEAHKAKNALATGMGEPTKTGQAVIDLQDAKRNPEYRVVYSSATGATDVRNMAYMVRLGLWGPYTSFPEGFKQFLSEINHGGMGAMEMVSRDMKSLGMYLSGSLSFGVDPRSGKAVEYRERIHRLTAEQRKIYNHAAAAWRLVLQNIEAALDVTNADPRARMIALKKFWGDHQRFFRQVICAFKLPTVIEEVEAALSANKSAVLSLVGTGEAKTREQIAQIAADGGSLEDMDFSPREILGAMIQRGFPTQLYEDKTDEASGKIIKVLVRDKSGNPVQSKAALQMKQRLLDGLSTLHLPENPLDQIVNHFGERNVAEITGRKRRLIRNPLTLRVEYKKRAPEGVAMQRVNVHCAEMFQKGQCRIAIISDAGSIGISLHASNRAANHQRRVHITVELGWSADKQMQCFGRTHRSDQAEPPEYVLLSTEVAGEKRFSSTIARRLGSLGALTKGDRGAADNADWARYNFETEEGKSALSLLYRRILAGETVPGLDDPRHTLLDIGLFVLRDGAIEVRKEEQRNVPRFLNRVLALDVDRQNALFDYFAELFDQTVRYAKANGTFDEGVTDIRALAIRVARPPVAVHSDPVTGAQTVLYILQVDQPSDRVSFERAERLRQNERGSFLRHQNHGGYVLALQSGHHTDPEQGITFPTFSLWKPEAARFSYIREAALNEKYAPVLPEATRLWWEAQHAQAPTVVTREMQIIGGAILPLWQRLKAKGDSKLSVVRVSTEDGQRIVGVEIARTRLAKVLKALGLSRTTFNPEDIFTGVLENDEVFGLASGLSLKRTKLQGHPAIELFCTDDERFDELRKLGVLNEQIRFKQRFFVPTDRRKGVAILSELLSRYPVVDTGDDDSGALDLPSEEIPQALQETVVELSEWILPPQEKSETVAVEPVSDDASSRDFQVSLSRGGDGPPLDVLAEQHATAFSRCRGKPRPVIEEQGVLFAFAEFEPSSIQENDRP